MPLFVLTWCLTAHAAGDQGGSSDFYRTATLPALKKIKQSMPAAPPGWIIQDETKIDDAQPVRYPKPVLGAWYQIRYRRVSGVREEQRKLDEVYAESSRRNREAVKPQIDELIRQQTIVSLALKKATRRRNEAAQKHLNDDLDENGKKMRALHEEVDRNISREVEPYLVRNAEALITVGINEQAAEVTQGVQAFEHHGAAFAFRKDGERAGATGWKEGMKLILFGNWNRSGENRFTATVRPDLPAGRAQTIRISIIGEPKLADQLLNAMDMKSILSLMHAD